MWKLQTIKLQTFSVHGRCSECCIWHGHFKNLYGADDKLWYQCSKNASLAIAASVLLFLLNQAYATWCCHIGHIVTSE